MKSVIVVAGFGSGISNAVAKKFGSTFKVALLSRTLSKLETAVHEAKAFVVDLSVPREVKSVIERISMTYGTIAVLFWNAAGAPKPVLESSDAEFDLSLRVSVTSLNVAVQTAIKDLEETKGTIMVTGGGLALENDQVVKLAVSWGADNLAVAKAAQRKYVHVLHETLKLRQIHVFELTVLSPVKGTPWDAAGTSTLTPESIADSFWDHHLSRNAVFDKIPSA